MQQQQILPIKASVIKKDYKNYLTKIISRESCPQIISETGNSWLANSNSANAVVFFIQINALKWLNETPTYEDTQKCWTASLTQDNHFYAPSLYWTSKLSFKYMYVTSDNIFEYLRQYFDSIWSCTPSSGAARVLESGRAHWHFRVKRLRRATHLLSRNSL